jgi:hypothetical protein
LYEFTPTKVAELDAYAAGCKYLLKAAEAYASAQLKKTITDHVETRFRDLVNAVKEAEVVPANVDPFSTVGRAYCEFRQAVGLDMVG